MGLTLTKLWCFYGPHCTQPPLAASKSAARGISRAKFSLEVRAPSRALWQRELSGTSPVEISGKFHRKFALPTVGFGSASSVSRGFVS